MYDFVLMLKKGSENPKIYNRNLINLTKDTCSQLLANRYVM